ncbi:helix-turn-helix transcriptional regulator [Nakamurella alba]|uniref:helix-turn-helix transcriptional regulator n=1 Tax=Nakamurella alba TaxID=2665158 RepID=UPI002AC355B2|nr:HTH domain-containing protein [Nakamurella alba]
MSGDVDARVIGRPDGHLTLKRVERQQWLIERLDRAAGGRIGLAELARELGVAERTVARDVERLRDTGVPLTVHRGRAGGVVLTPVRAIASITFDLPELAAITASMAVLGPGASDSAASAIRKLVLAMVPTDTPATGSRRSAG